MDYLRSGERTAALVLDVLAGSAQPLSAYENMGRLQMQRSHAAPTTYRELHRLTDAGSIHRLATLRAYVARHSPAETAGPVNDLSALFTIYEGCGSVHEILDADLRGRLQRYATLDNFVTQCGTVELLGVCAGCDTSGRAAAS